MVGTGSQGALLCVALAGQGSTPHALKAVPGRLALALELGAKAAARDDRDFDLVFETSGSPAAFTEAVRRTTPGGSIAAIGMSSDPLPLTTQAIVTRQLTVRGSLVYDHPGDFAATLRSDVGVLRPERVLRACHPLADVALAFAAAREAPGKTWIRVSD